MQEVGFHESEARLANAFDDAWVNGYRAVNDRAVNDRSVNDRAVNDRSVNDRSVNDRSVNDHPTSTIDLHQRSTYINDRPTSTIDLHQRWLNHAYPIP